jgi:very-short-patch-repair endonuclease
MPRPSNDAVTCPPNAARRRAIAALAATQDGLVTRTQLLALGLSTSAVRRRLADGTLWRIFPGVYAVGHPSLSRRARARAALLLGGPGSALVDRTAAALIGLLVEPPDAPIHLAPGRGRPDPRPELVVHRLRLAPLDVVEVNGLVATGPARTLVDLAAHLGDRELARALNEAQIRTRTSAADILSVIERSPGRRTSRLRTLVEGASGIRRSGLEDALWEALRQAHLTSGARTNATVAGWELDVLWHAERVAVETDGFRYHRTRADRLRDARKQRAVRAAGVELLRYADEEVEHERPRVIAEVATALAVARASGR